jgi:hypothetical protein
MIKTEGIENESNLVAMRDDKNDLINDNDLSRNIVQTPDHTERNPKPNPNPNPNPNSTTYTTNATPILNNNVDEEIQTNGSVFGLVNDEVVDDQIFSLSCSTCDVGADGKTKHRNWKDEVSASAFDLWGRQVRITGLGLGLGLGLN